MSTSPILESRLPLFRTELSDPFVVTGVDFRGPVYYKITKSSTAKAYITLFTSASRPCDFTTAQPGDRDAKFIELHGKRLAHFVVLGKI